MRDTPNSELMMGTRPAGARESGSPRRSKGLPTGSLFALLLLASGQAVMAKSSFDALPESLDGASGEIQDGSERLALPDSAWRTSLRASDNAVELWAAAKRSVIHGLNSDVYDVDALTEKLARVEADVADGKAITHLPTIDAHWREVERHLDSTFLQLVKHLGEGVTDARNIQAGLFREPPTVDADALLFRVKRGDLSVYQALTQVTPGHVQYQRLTQTMADLLAERYSGSPRTHVDNVGQLWAGHEHDDVLLVKKRLIETGDFPANGHLSNMFDAPLVVALKAFQSHHGLAPSGNLDKLTVDALNLTVDEEIERVAMSLERWRWMPRDLGHRHVLVNLPDYRLHMMNGDQKIIDMAVVIGATKHKTPVFSEDLLYLEVAPTWTVPRGIAQKELLPKERRKPGYLESKGFDYMKVVNGRLRKIPHSDVSRADLDRKPFPYYLRQRSGGRNALGRVKFMMPNPYSIYLHDTPAKRLFKEHDRAYSHGCIRLSDPTLLGNVMLQVDGKSSRQASSLLSRKETTRVRLRSPVPTHLAYYTSWVNEEGRLQHRKDVYGHDPALLKALRNNNTLLSILNQIPTEAEEQAASTQIAAIH